MECQAQMKTFNYLYGAILGETILRHTDNLSSTLQHKTLSAAEGQQVAMMTIATLSSLCSEKIDDEEYCTVLQQESTITTTTTTINTATSTMNIITSSTSISKLSTTTTIIITTINTATSTMNIITSSSSISKLSTTMNIIIFITISCCK
ncbi:hypothetical protein EMCRGX_G014862 [Ephydatia muelleri]